MFTYQGLDRNSTLLTQMRWHGRWVATGRIILPIIIIGMLALLLWESASPSQQAVPDWATGWQAGHHLIVNGSWQGQDQTQQPYEISCSLARQATPDAVIELTDPQFTFFDPEGRWWLVKAQRGVYDHGAATLQLTQTVNVLRDDGLELMTEAAEAELHTGRISGQTAVTGQNRTGIISAQGFAIENWGQVIRFDEQVNVTGF